MKEEFFYKGDGNVRFIPYYNIIGYNNYIIGVDTANSKTDECYITVTISKLRRSRVNNNRTNKIKTIFNV